MQQIKSFAVVQTAKVIGILYFILGAILVVPFSLMRLAAGRAAFGGFFVLLAPIAYGVAGFLMTALLCWLYNMLAKRIGGIRVELG